MLRAQPWATWCNSLSAAAATLELGRYSIRPGNVLAAIITFDSFRQPWGSR